MNFPEISINNIAVIPIVIGLVQFMKKFGLSGEKLTALSAILGVAFGVLYQVSTIYPQTQVVINVVVYGLAVGLSCSGLYDLSQISNKAAITSAKASGGDEPNDRPSSAG